MFNFVDTPLCVDCGLRMQIIVKKSTLYYNGILTKWSKMAKKRNRHAADIKRARKRKLKSNNQKNA